VVSLQVAATAVGEKGVELRRCKEAGMADLTELFLRDIHDTVFVRSILDTELKRTVPYRG
jgi:hypothetical protein